METIVILGFFIITLLYSIILHEVSHAVMALWLGDRTAKDLGRITLDPIPHIDIVGSIIVPLVMFFTSGFTFGWAKPVPYNPNNLRDKKWGDVLVAFAGPITNFILALVAAGIAALLPVTNSVKGQIVISIFNRDWSELTSYVAGNVPAIIFSIMAMAIFWNVLLGVFNLIPIPPLDGSKLLYKFVILDIKTRMFLEQWGILIIFILLMFPLFSAGFQFILNVFWNSFFAIAFL